MKYTPSGYAKKRERKRKKAKLLQALAICPNYTKAIRDGDLVLWLFFQNNLWDF